MLAPQKNTFPSASNRRPNSSLTERDWVKYAPPFMVAFAQLRATPTPFGVLKDPPVHSRPCSMLAPVNDTEPSASNRSPSSSGPDESSTDPLILAFVQSSAIPVGASNLAFPHNRSPSIFAS